jgi:dTDP-4-dehydrorhamnose 3,5-epimerase
VKFVPLGVPGTFLVEIEPHGDARGAFARTFCAREFGERGLATEMVQTSLSLNSRRGTLRGLHWQAEPHTEAKLVRCVRGRIYDVVVDVRRSSHAFRQHVAIELSAEAHNAIYIPEGVAHGFLTLADDCEVHYAMSGYFAPEAARGARYDDPAFGIAWPEPIAVVAERDLAWPVFEI